MKSIIKRDGRVVPYDESKITTAIWKAMRDDSSLNKTEAKRLSGCVTDRLDLLFPVDYPTVEQIQDIVENVLIYVGYTYAAKAYILYRKQHADLRQLGDLVSETQLIDDYLNDRDWRVRENSNMTYSLQGLNTHLSEHIVKHYWLNKIYPKQVKEAHNNGDLHIHDLGTLGAYCVGWDLQDLLMRGFRGVRGKVESRPAKHFRVALLQVVNFMYTLQGESAGAQAFSNLDTYLAPFIRYGNLNYAEVKQNMQEFVYNMNVPTRVGFQTPFTNVTLDLEVPKYMKDDHVIIGGALQQDKYKDFQHEMDMFNRAFAEVMTEGDMQGRPFTFPIPTYNITKEFNWENKNLAPVWEMTAKYGIPYFSNFINSDMSPEDARSMCPLEGKEEILIKSSRGWGLEKTNIKTAYHDLSKKKEQSYEVFSQGKFIACSVEKYNNQELIEVELVNGHKIRMTKTHDNTATTEFGSQEIKEIPGGGLREGYYLPYSLKPLEGEGGSFDLGFIIGCYAGDGSLDRDTGVIFSLSKGKKEETLASLVPLLTEGFGARYSIREEGENISLRVKSKALNGLCRDFVTGTGRNKDYSPNVFGMSKEARRGIYFGHYATDGGNRHRIYTSSEKMVRSLNLLAATLGTTTNVTVDERGKEDGSLSDEPIYTVRFYQFNDSHREDLWYKTDDFVWMKIKSIKEIRGDTGYCLTVLHDEPLFTVAGSGIVTHNCRLRIDNRELKKRGGGLFGANPLTGSIGVVTINLPRLGYLAQNEAEFFSRLEELMELAKKSLIIKRKTLENLTERGLYPYSRFYLQSIKDLEGGYWKNHFSTIGIIGMNEAALNFLNVSIADPEGREFAERVLDFMRDRLADFQEETGEIFNLEATPAEGSSYSLARKDKEMYPDIRFYNIDRYGGDVPYYTNSSQLPVGLTEDLFEALTMQDPLQTRYTGGTVFHGFIGENGPTPEAAKSLVRKIAENFHLPYYTLTPTFSVCPKHGYIPGEHKYCPKCDEELVENFKENERQGGVKVELQRRQRG